MALHNLHGSKQSGLLSRVEHECSNEDNVPIMDKFQTRRHSLHGNNIFVCKTRLPEPFINIKGIQIHRLSKIALIVR